MTKTKKQLRAEAVERLKANEPDNIYLAIHQAIGWSGDVLHTDEEWRAALIYLLTDDANDDSTPEKVVSGSEPCVTPLSSTNGTGNGEDSREKIEAEASELVADYAASGDVCDALYHGMLGLLDRQAAITAEETSDAWEEYRDATQLEITELQAQVDELQEQLRIGWECECRLQAERERYREKFGKCLDYADAIHALMDDEGMA